MSLGRREFIAVVVGAVSACPLVTSAQHEHGSVRRIAVLIPSSPVASVFIQSLREGLEKLEWFDGKNVQLIKVEFRSTAGDVHSLKSEAAKLVALAPEIIVSGGTQATIALKEITGSIPIVFVHVADPLAGSLIQSLARPGGNITGFAAYESSIGGKWLELLKEIAPHVNHVLVLVGQNPTWRMHVPTMQGAALTLNVKLTITHVRDAAAIERAINALAGEPNRGMIVLPDNLLDERRELVVRLAAKHRIPDVYGSQEASGGLLFYSSDWADLYRRAASYVDQILKGAKPGALPVQQPTKFRLVINLKTAKALGLTIPSTLLAIADEVIE